MTTTQPDRYRLGSRTVHRLGYGTMQLTGPQVMGPPKDRKAALELLRAAVDLGIDHLDTSDLYGPHVTNDLIREALHPYPDNLVIATKVGMVRGPGGSWDRAASAADIERAVHDNLRNLRLDVLEVVNFRASFSVMGPAEGSLEAPLTALADLQRRGLLKHIGLSNVTAAQVAQGRTIAPIACVQNHYNFAHRADDPLIDQLASAGIAYVPFFPLGGFSPLQFGALDAVAARRGATARQVALAWLLHRAPNVLLIPGTTSLAHLRENLASASLVLTPQELDELASP